MAILGFSIKLIFFGILIIYRIGLALSAFEGRERGANLNKRKKKKLFKEMARRGYKRKYFTHPQLRTFEEKIYKYYLARKNKSGELCKISSLYFQKIAAEDRLLNQLIPYVEDKNAGKLFLDVFIPRYNTKAIRRIEEWSADPRINLYQNNLKLLQFVFEKYEVQGIFRQIWFTWNRENYQYNLSNGAAKYFQSSQLNKALFELYFHLAKGENIRSYWPMNIKPSKKEAHLWMNTPSELYINVFEAYWRAIYLAKGGAKNWDFIYHSAFSFDHLDFWKQFIGIIARDEDKYPMTANQIGEMTYLLSWIKFGEAFPQYDFSFMENCKGILPDFSLKKETLRSIQKKIYKNINSDYQIPKGFKSCYSFIDEKGKFYEIKHLNSRFELQKEGQLMSNCLGEWNYHEEATKKDSHFWSLRIMDKLPEGSPVVSIQISNKEIIEYQAEDNTCPLEEHLQIIRQWAKGRQLLLCDYE